MATSTKEVTALVRIDQIAESNLMQAAGGKMTRALAIADAMQELRQLVTQQMLERVKFLQGTDLGFRTDRDDKSEKGCYPFETLRDVLIEAAVRGYSPAGNEFNIIAGRFYATKNGLERKVREFPGLTDLRLVEGVPQKMSDGALVEYHADWKLNGRPDEIRCCQNGASDTRIACRVNAGMGIDAILGKAKRKMLARIYSRLTGSHQSPGESEQDDDRHASPQQATDILTKAKAEIDQSNSLQEVLDCVVWAHDMLSDAGNAELEAYANEARERIRASRGERSKQEVFPDAKTD